MNPNLIITNPERLEEIKEQIKKEGTNSIHVITDFDRTLTKTFYNGLKAGSIISHLRKDKGRYLSKDYAEKAQELFDKYHPMEINPSMPQEEKNKEMYKWWKAHKELLIESGFDKPTIEQSTTDMINEASLELRKGVEEFLETLNKNNIPLIIMSSSLGDLVEEFLKQKNLLTNNIHIIANEFKFNQEGKAIGIERIIHVFNKNEMTCKDLPIYQELTKRKNVILLGDSLGDLGMIEGFDYNNLIKIGFLNDKIEEHLEQYKQAFDIIITNDKEFDYVNELIGKLI